VFEQVRLAQQFRANRAAPVESIVPRMGRWLAAFQGKLEVRYRST
jgi:hypothetical protein